MSRKQVGRYNELIEEKYRLSVQDDTLGVLVLSIPDMWENAFIPFVKQQDWDNWNKEKNPLDECMIYHFDQVKQSFPEHDVEVMHQFEMHNGQAKILVQTAAHVAGATYYYQKRDVTEQPWRVDEKIYGVSFHPVYGRWVSLDGVFIFKDVLCPDLPQRVPKDVLSDQKERVELLDIFREFEVPRKFTDEHEEYLFSDLHRKIDIARRIKSS